jgi:hypothetical protein
LLDCSERTVCTAFVEQSAKLGIAVGIGRSQLSEHQRSRSKDRNSFGRFGGDEIDEVVTTPTVDALQVVPD